MNASVHDVGALSKHFRGEITMIAEAAPSEPARQDELSLPFMAKLALNYLRGNPDPKRGYECKFSLGPLGIPSHVPLLPPNRYGYDPIVLGDTECRMDMQYAHMREMAGEPLAEAVELGVRQRIVSYRHADNLVWLNPAAWVDPADVTLRRGDATAAIAWSGPADAYVVCPSAPPGERLTLRWPVPRFAQTFVPQSVPNRQEKLTVQWLGNQVLGVEPRGKYLPMFGTEAKR